MTLTKLAHGIVLAWGWRRILIAFLAGAATTLALPPFGIWPVAFLTFPVLVWLIDGAGAGRLGGVMTAAITGWWFGFGYFVTGLYWIGNAFLVDAKNFGWLMPFAILGLPAYLAFYPALGLALARLIWTRGAARILALAFALTLAEWLRGHLLTGFPWNAYGYALMSPLVSGAGGCPHRPVGDDVRGRGGVRLAGCARRRSRRYRPSVAGAGAECRACLPLWRSMARFGLRSRRRLTSTTSEFGSCSRTCSRTRSSIMRRSSR